MLGEKPDTYIQYNLHLLDFTFIVVVGWQVPLKIQKETWKVIISI